MPFRSIYYFIKNLLRLIEKNIPKVYACYLHNFFLLCIKSKLRFNYNKQDKLFLAYENNEKRYFSDLDRGFDLYGRSLFIRGKILFDSYCLKHIKFKKDIDIVIDCGANYADLFLALNDLILEKNYVTFEPNPKDFNGITKSVPNAQNFNLGLSNREKELDLFIRSEAGDSCIVEPAKWTKKIKVKMITLDKFIKLEKIYSCKLLKLEAEGWGPEVLEGSQEFMKICEYIAIDGSAERGKKKDITFHELNNILLKNDYTMIDINGPSYRALYKNIKHANFV